MVQEKDSGSCPVKHGSSLIANASIVEQMTKDGCPVEQDVITNKNKLFAMSPLDVPKTADDVEYNAAVNDMKFSDSPLPNQKEKLSITRAVSNIPKGNFTPSHQPQGIDRWVYPSEQQYFNAMKKKGFNPDEKDISVILAIHNIVNEKGWEDILRWESLRGSHTPKLKRFCGRPNDLSPKAYLRTLLGYSPPFDRHDWIIDREGEEVRYVIDFYNGKRSGAYGAPISMHMDVRPALDSPLALVDRLVFSFREYFNPGSLRKVHAHAGDRRSNNAYYRQVSLNKSTPGN